MSNNVIVRKLNLPNDKLVQLLENALLLGSASALTYIVDNVQAADFGTYGPIIVSVLGVLLSWIHKVVSNPAS